MMTKKYLAFLVLPLILFLVLLIYTVWVDYSDAQYHIESGRVIKSDQILFGLGNHNGWYRPSRYPNITRLTIDQNGDTLYGPNKTEDIGELINMMHSAYIPVFEHNPGLWYDQRRAKHDRVCRGKRGCETPVSNPALGEIRARHSLRWIEPI